jgi:hypothetical protein
MACRVYSISTTSSVDVQGVSLSSVSTFVKFFKMPDCPESAKNSETEISQVTEKRTQSGTGMRRLPD